MPPIIEPTEQQLENIVQPYLDKAPTGGGLGIVIGYASPNFSNIYPGGSLLNQVQQPLTLTNDTPFELASVSKTFTATLYALLIQNAQKQNLTLGDFPLDIGAQFQSIPIETLVNYTSGLPADNETATDLPSLLPAPYSSAGMLGFLNLPNKIALTQSGTVYAYSNLGFALASAVLPFLCGDGTSSYESLIQSQIWRQLGFSGSTSFFTDVRLDQLPLGYEYGGTSPVAVAAGNKAFPAYHGAGGVVSTPNDMMKWLQFNMGIQQDAVLSPLLPVLQNPSTNVMYGATGIGLAWFMTGEATPYSPYPAIFKDGGLSGVSSYIAFLPAPTEPLVMPSPAGVFVLTNSAGLYNSKGMEMSAAVAYSVLNIMQGYPLLPS
jgi:serine-type D-Ala-D-Ala carboxypeptidase/endopeptidase